MEIMADQADKRLSDVPRRGLPRHAVTLDAWLRDGETRFRIKVSDLSCDGCRVEGDFLLEQATEVWLKISGLTPRAARVAWSCPGLAGCEFVDALEEGSVATLLERETARQQIHIIDRREGE